MSPQRKVALTFGILGLIAGLIAVARAVKQIRDATEDADRENDVLQPRR